MSDWHFGIDYDLWLYPEVDWTSPDFDCELPEPIEAAKIERTLLVNADDAIKQVRNLLTDNAKLRELVKLLFACVRQGEDEYGTDWSCAGCDFCDSCDGLIQAREAAIELGVEVGK